MTICVDKTHMHKIVNNSYQSIRKIINAIESGESIVRVNKHLSYIVVASTIELKEQ